MPFEKVDFGMRQASREWKSWLPQRFLCIGQFVHELQPLQQLHGQQQHLEILLALFHHQAQSTDHNFWMTILAEPLPYWEKEQDILVTHHNKITRLIFFFSYNIALFFSIIIKKENLFGILFLMGLHKRFFPW